MSREATHAEAMARAVARLAPKQQARLGELLRRSDALSNAYAAVFAEEVPNEATKAETLEVLEELREEANQEVRRFREEVGIPAPRL